MKVGTLVAVWRDNGEVLITTTRSNVQRDYGVDVVFLNGLSSYYALTHVRPVQHIDPAALGELEAAMKRLGG